MYANEFAILVLATLAVPLLAIVVSPAWLPRPWMQVALSAAPILAIGVICAMVLSVYGAPLAEWLFPLLGVLAAGVFVGRQRIFAFVRACEFGLAVILSLYSCFFLYGEYTAAPSMTASMDRNLESIRLRQAAERLRKAYPEGKVLSEGPVSDLLPSESKAAKTRYENEWHTPFTRLRRIEKSNEELWYPGGPVEKGTQGLEWREP